MLKLKSIGQAEKLTNSMRNILNMVDERWRRTSEHGIRDER